MSAPSQPPASNVLKAVIRDLHRQATTENSHYYTAKVLEMMLDYIETVNATWPTQSKPTKSP